jgi:hypothetical protein
MPAGRLLPMPCAIRLSFVLSVPVLGAADLAAHAKAKKQSLV